MEIHIANNFNYITAVKCNPDPAVIQTLARLGARFDCASIGEIEQIMSFGVTSESIILSNPTKYISHIRFAKEKNIDLIVVDNNFELEKMSKHYATARYENHVNQLKKIIYSIQLSILKLGSTYSL